MASICQNCSAALGLEDKFCGECGTSAERASTDPNPGTHSPSSMRILLTQFSVSFLALLLMVLLFGLGGFYDLVSLFLDDSEIVFVYSIEQIVYWFLFASIFFVLLRTALDYVNKFNASKKPPTKEVFVGLTAFVSACVVIACGKAVLYGHTLDGVIWPLTTQLWIACAISIISSGLYWVYSWMLSRKKNEVV